MSDATRLLSAVTFGLPVDGAQTAEAIDALRMAALACTTCADATIGEDGAHDLRACVRACTTTSEICDVAARVLARAGGYDLPVVRNLLEASAKACSTSGEICASHGDVHKHCRLCAEACRRAEQAVQQLLVAMAAIVT